MFQTPLSQADIGVLDYRPFGCRSASLNLGCAAFHLLVPQRPGCSAVDRLLGNEAQSSTGTPSRSQQINVSTNRFVSHILEQLNRIGAQPLRGIAAALAWQLTCQCRA